MKIIIALAALLSTMSITTPVVGQNNYPSSMDILDNKKVNIGKPINKKITQNSDGSITTEMTFENDDECQLIKQYYGQHGMNANCNGSQLTVTINPKSLL